MDDCDGERSRTPVTIRPSIPETAVGATIVCWQQLHTRLHEPSSRGIQVVNGHLKEASTQYDIVRFEGLSGPACLPPPLTFLAWPGFAAAWPFNANRPSGTH